MPTAAPPRALETLYREARETQAIIDRIVPAINRTRESLGRAQNAGVPSSDPLVVRLTFQMRQLQGELAEQRALRDRIMLAIGTVEPPPPPPPPPPRGWTPPSGVWVDPASLLLDRAPLKKVSIPDFSNVGGVHYPAQSNTVYTDIGVSHGGALAIQQGVGPDGILAAKCAPWTGSQLAYDAKPYRRWCFKAFGPADWLWDRCEINDVGDEHGLYKSGPWACTMNRVRFSEIGSQGVQDTIRDHEMQTPNQANDPNGDGSLSFWKLTDCAFLEVGKPTGGRPSYAASFFERQGASTYVHTGVEITGCYFQSTKYENFASGGVPWGSYGAIMAHGRPEVRIANTRVDYRNPNRAVVQCWGPGKGSRLTIANCHFEDPFEGKTVQLDIRGYEFVSILGCEGNFRADIYSLLCPWYVFDNPPGKLNPYKVASTVQGQDVELVVAA